MCVYFFFSSFLSFSFPASAFFMNFYERILATYISFQLAITMALWLNGINEKNEERYIDI